MSQEYKYVAKISADTSELEKVLSKAQGKLQRLSEDEVLIKLDYDGNIAAFNKTFNKMLKAAPELTIQFQYDVNKKILDQEINKLQQLTDLKMTIDEGSATAKVKSMLADLDKAYFNDAKESELYSRIDNIIRYANTISGLGAKLDNSWLTEIENYADAGKSINDLLQKNAEKPLKLFEIDTSLDDTIKKTQDRINEFQDVLESLKKKGASELSETNEFKELSDQVKILTADIAEMKQQLGNLSGEAFDDMSESVGRLEEKLGFALQRIQELKEANVNPNNLSFHVGELEDDKFRWKSESMNRVIQNMNWGNFGRKEKGGIGLGYGILGTGVYHTPKIEEIEIGGDNPKGYALNIDPSKYNLLIRNTTKEATKLLKFLSAFQGFTIARGSGYSEWDEALKGVDVKSLYKQFVDVFGETAMDIKEFSDFVDSMLSQVSEMAKFGFDNKGNFKLSGTKWDHADTPVTQLLKKLGYEGIDLRGTYWDSYEQGSTIFDLHPEDIIKSFDSQEKMESYWEKNQKAIKEFKTDASKALGEAGESIVKLTKYVEELNDKLDMLASKVNAISDVARITSATADMTSAAVEGMKDGQHSHSPSVDGENEGDNLVDGYVGRIRERIPEARAVGEALSKSTIEGLDKGSDIKFFSDESGQLSFIEKINNAEKELAGTMDKVSESAKESTEQIEGQLSLDFSKAVEGPKKYELAIVKTTDVLNDLQESAKKAFNADIGQGSIFKINELLKDSYAKTQESLAQKNRAEEIKKSESAIRDYISEIEKATDKTDEFASSIKKAIDVSKKADAGSSIDLLGDLQENVRSDTEHARKDIERLLKSIEKFEDVQKYTSSFIDRVKQVEFELKELAEQEFISPDKVATFQKLVKSLQESSKYDYNKNFKELTRTKYLEQISQYLNKYTGLSKNTRTEIENIALAMKKANDAGELKKLYDDFLKIKIGARQAGEETQSMFTKIGNRLDDMNSKFIAQFLSWQDLIRYARELADNVIALDSAITELRKVSDASSERLSQSFEKSTQTAMDLGQSIEHVINVTADWSRLGYDVDAAEELARVTTLFTTVGDNMSSDDASSYLISTLQGYQLAADQAEDIVDKYNQVANRFAIDTAGIGEALQRSAASFNAANTDLSESIALITATNEVVQNPESVGTLWKTLSARIRGAKTELEELGEETDAYTETTSTLRDLVQGLTGFDIMKSETEFKSIYDIILGIGEAWDDLTDVERASLGEALAGKRNANALYAVLGNLDTLKDAYKEAEEASGSAEREQENYAKSIQYSLDRLKASIEELSYDFLNSGMLKGAIEFANSFLQLLDELIDKAGSFSTVLGVIAGSILTFRKVGFGVDYNKATDSFSMSLFGNILGQSSNIPELENIEKFGSLIDSGVKYSDAYKQSLQSCSKETKKFAVECVKAHKSSQEMILSFKGGKNASDVLATSLKALGATLASLAINFGISFVISKTTEAIVAMATAEENAAERTRELGSQYENANKDIASYKTEISNLYEVLNDSTSSYVESKNAREQLLKIQDELIDKYGAEQGAIENITSAINGQIDALDELSQKKWQEAKNELNSPSDNSWISRLQYWYSNLGYEDAYDRVIQQMQGVNTYALNMSNENLGNGDSAGFSKEDISLLKSLTESYQDLNLVLNEETGQYYLTGQEMNSFYDSLLRLQGQVERYGGSDKLNDWLKLTVDNTKAVIDANGSFYDSFIQNEKIAKSADYSKSVDSITALVKEYNKAYEEGFASEEDQSIAVENLSKAWTDILSNIDDADVQGYINRMYPEIKQIVDSWQFDLHFNVETGDYKERIQAEIDRFQRANGEYVSYESLKNFNPKEYDASDDRVLAYYELEKAAQEYGFTIDWLIEKLKQEQILLTDDYQNLIQKYGKENIESLLPSDLEIAIELSKQTFTSWEAFKSAIDSAKEKIEETKDAAKELSFTESISDLHDLESALNNVGTAIANIDENGKFELGDLDSIADYFLGLDNVEYEVEAVSNALKLLGEGTGSLEQQADAINTLADNYLHTSGILDGLTEKNKELYIIRLQEMGIINAEAIVLETLNQQKAQEADIDKLLADRGLELIEITAAEIQELIDEGVVTQDTGRYIAALAYQKQFANGNPLDTSADINNLIQLLNTLGATTTALETYNKVKNGANGMPSSVVSQYKKQAEQEIKNALTVAKSTTQAKYNVPKVQYSGGSPVSSKLGYTPSSTADALSAATKKAADEASKAADSAKDEFEELYDYFERMIKVLDNSIDLLEAHLEDVVGSFAKNTLLDAEEDLIQSKMNGYSSAIDMYSQKASEALSKIPSDIAEKIQNGAVDIDEFIGESNKDVVEAIQEYEKWADKVQDCKLQLVQLKEAIRQLELDKFNNVMQDFTDQFDLRQSAGIDLISKQIDLLQEAGELIGESFYKRQQEQAQKQLQILTREQEALVNQLNKALSKGVDVGSEEWVSMVDSLTDVEGKILDCQKAIESFDNAILELHTEIFNRIQDQFSAFASELSNMQELINDDANPVATVKNQWTNEGLAQLGLLAQQYELAKYQVAQYNEEIERLNQLYLQGRYSTTEYADKLIELKNAQWSAVEASESALDSIRSLNQERVNIVVEGINEEIEAYEKYTQSIKDNLSAEKDLHDYQKQIADENKSILDIQRQLAAIQDDDSQAARAKRAKLEEQLKEAQDALAETEYSHNIDAQQEALDEELERYKETRQAEIDALQESLLNVEQILSDTFEAVRSNSQLIGETILAQAQAHGIEMSQALTDAWFQGENAIAHYGEILSSATSNFIGQIQGVEYQVYELQNQANATAEGLAYMFSTRADNLVDELVRSYTSEANLDAMTNALHDSLSNTIDGNYSGASAASALNSIADAANGVADAANAAASALRSMMDAQNAQLSEQTKKYTIVDSEGNLQGFNTTTKSDLESRGFKVIGNKAYAYAKGTKGVPFNQLAWTQEDGPEAIINPNDGSILTPLQKGSAVLPTDQTSNIWEWSRFNPEEFASKLIQTIGNVEGGKVQTNTMQVGSLITVNGNVNDTMEMVQIATNTASAKIKESFNELSNSLNK